MTIAKHWETCETSDSSWGYMSYDHDWKSVSELLYWFVNIASKGGNYRLNIGPDGRGACPRTLHGTLARNRLPGNRNRRIQFRGGSDFEQLGVVMPEPPTHGSDPTPDRPSGRPVPVFYSLGTRHFLYQPLNSQEHSPGGSQTDRSTSDPTFSGPRYTGPSAPQACTFPFRTRRYHRRPEHWCPFSGA